MAASLDRVYEQIVGDEDARVCRDISDDACRVVPGNFFRQVAAFTLTKLGDTLISPKTTLTWIFAAVAAPVWMVGWLVPVREAGSLLPQLVIGAFVRRRPVRKWVWVLGGALQAAAVAAMAGATLLLTGPAAGFALLGALVVFSLARGLCSVASKDVKGKTVPKTRRGRLGGYASSAAGLISIAVAGGLLYGFDSREPTVLAGLLLLAAVLWLLATVLYGTIAEYPGETEGGGHALREAFARLALLRTDPAFRNFVLARSLLLVSALSAPYVVLLARDRMGGAVDSLPLFIVAAGLASLVSSPFWGAFADTSSRRTMIFSAVLASLVAGLAIVLDALLAPDSTLGWLFVVLFFVLAIAHAGVRLGRKTYIVDLASGNRRTDYVAVSNTVIGAVLLLVGALTGIASVVSVPAALALLTLMGVAGAWLSSRLPEVT